MSDDLATLLNEPRVVIEVPLRPVAGTRFQPTGFPDLGPATFTDPEGKPTLLVESAQSMANRLEAVCWDEEKEDVVSDLQGMPFVQVTLKGLGDGKDKTNSLLEFHRLNSPYIMSGTMADGKTFADFIKGKLGLGSAPRTEAGSAEGESGEEVAGVVNLRKLAEVCFAYDPNSLVHGVFLEKIAGRLRHPRALSAFVEASDVGRADSGGVKFDRVLPAPKAAGLDAKGGYGNVPFHRTEFTAKTITAYFSLDLAQIRGYGQGSDVTAFLTALSLWKVRRLLDVGLRLRTACDLELMNDDGAVTARRPKGFALPPAAALAKQVAELLDRCKSRFASPAKTELTWTTGTRPAPRRTPRGA
jgi:CRISPR-associated protein Csb1